MSVTARTTSGAVAAIIGGAISVALGTPVHFVAFAIGCAAVGYVVAIVDRR